MPVKSELSMDGAVATLPATVQRKAGLWAASKTLAELPDADPEFQRDVLKALLCALGLDTWHEPEPIEVPL